MTDGDDAQLTVWQASDAVTISPSESNPATIVKLASPTLSSRDMKSIVSAFQSNSYEMVSTFIWTKSSANLKKQLSTLGMEFIGEMLGRIDLSESSDPSSIADYEVITLAEDLGVFNSTQGLRLKHALQLVSHYAGLDQNEAESDPMQQEDALSILKTCVQTVLGQPQFSGALKFATFRKRLGSVTLSSKDNDIETIVNSPYFFVKTTLSALLSMVKTEKGATLEHAVGNTGVIVPIVWDRLRAPEKWQIGQAYAEVSTAGNRTSSAGLKRVLVSVRGFDFVPESLRSNTFTEAAARVLAAHFAFNNFYNEEEPMTVLANLGTAIPMPAFGKCMEATLAVWLGNQYGKSYGSVPQAQQLLSTLRLTQWEYYLDNCLPCDRTVLDKLADDKPLRRWRTLIVDLVPAELKPKNQRVRQLLDLTRSNASAVTLQQRAHEMRTQIATQ